VNSLFRPLDEREAGQVVAWRPPALAAPRRADDAVRTALEAAGIEGGFQVSNRRGGRTAPSSPVSVHARDQLASMVASARVADDPAPVVIGTGVDASPDARPTPIESPVAPDRFDEGFDEGFDQGFEAGALDARASLGEGVRAVIEAFGAEHGAWRAAREREIVSLANALAAAILRRELVDDPSSLERLVGETLAPFDGDTPTPVVQLHPLDLDAVGTDGGGLQGVELVADASLQRGDCRIRSGASLIEAGVEDRLSALLADEVP